MTRWLHLLRQLPTWARYLALWICVCLPLIALRPLLPQDLAWVIVLGLSACVASLGASHALSDFLTRRRGAKLDQEIGAQTTGPSRLELAEKEKEYKQKWKEGLQKLERSKISLYQLPWYIILGEPGGGKTMTLLNSGMDFPLGKEELAGFGGTRNYNWWFTNFAVILDTAGRLVFEQEGTTDRQEWEAFLALLKRRRRCPINGVVIALPADKLMSDSAEQRHHSAGIIRDRLRQIQSVLDVRFPVFLLITKADLVAGFTEFYNELDSLQRNQLFGWSRPGPFDQPFDPGDFKENFDTLYARLSELRVQFLAGQTSETERGWIYTYPEAFRALQERLQNYLDVLFSKNIFAESLFFRGFYFTSALQEGKPMLDILGAHLSDEQLENLEGLFPQSRAFFIHDFYVEKVAKEQGMVFRSQKHIKRMRLLRRSTLFVGAPLALLLAVLTVLGYRTYQETVAGPRQVVASAVALIEQHRQAGQSNPPDMAEAVELSHRLDKAVEAVKHPRGLAAIMFSSIGTEAENSIRGLQRELIGHCILRPELARVEEALTSTALEIPPDQIADFGASLATYIHWHAADAVGDLQEFEQLRLSLPQADFLHVDELEQFVGSPDNPGGGRLAAGLPGDLEHHRQVIAAAIDKVQENWLAAAEVSRNPEFRWWSELVQRCGEVREQYSRLLDARRDFDNASQIRSYEQVREQWLNAFPQPASAAPPADSPVLLLDRVRAHLSSDPPLADGQIIVPEKLVQIAQRRNESFWNTLIAALKESARDPRGQFADEQIARIEEFQTIFRDKMQAAGNRFVPQVDKLGLVVQALPSMLAPKRFALTAGAERVEGVAAELAKALSPAGSTDLPSLTSWTNQLRELTQAGTPPDLPEVDAEWQPERLRQLAKSIQDARRRVELQLVVEQIAERLDPPPQQGLAELMVGHGEPAKSLRFAGLVNRHSETFMLRTVRGKQDLRAALDAAVEQALLVDNRLQLSLLSRGLERYLERFLADWSEAYDRYHLAPLREYELPRRWTEYRRWMRNNAQSLRTDYEGHLDAVMLNVAGLFRSSGGPSASLREELRSSSKRVSWPAQSRLEEFIGQLMGSETPLDPRPVLADWRRFEQQVEAFHFSRLAGLKEAPVVFESLGGGDPRAAGLSLEWLTRQLQYVVEHGRWVLWAEIIQKLRSDLLGPGSAPFILVDGSYAETDPLQLQAALRAIDSMQGFAALAANQAGWQDPPHSDQPNLQQWVAGASRWHRFLSKPSVEINLTYLGGGKEKNNSADFYQQLALRLPGLSIRGGSARPELVFNIGEASGLTTYLWKPQKGRAEASLRGMTGRAKGLNAAIEPRISQLSGGSFGLLELIDQHGKPLNERRDQWLVELTIDISEIQGFENETIEKPSRTFALRIDFVDLEGGLPTRIVEPDVDTLLGPVPQPPWVLAEQDR